MKLIVYAVATLVTPVVALADSSSDFDQSLKLAEQKGCFECHTLGRSYIGPSFAAMARHYRRDPEARDRLPYVIRGGSAGHWGERYVMWPRANLSDAEVQQLLQWILSQ